VLPQVEEREFISGLFEVEGKITDFGVAYWGEWERDIDWELVRT